MVVSATSKLQQLLIHSPNIAQEILPFAIDLLFISFSAYFGSHIADAIGDVTFITIDYMLCGIIQNLKKAVAVDEQCPINFIHCLITKTYDFKGVFVKVVALERLEVVGHGEQGFVLGHHCLAQSIIDPILNIVASKPSALKRCITFVLRFYAFNVCLSFCGATLYLIEVVGV